MFTTMCNMNKKFDFMVVFQGHDSQARSYTSSLEEENAHLQASIERLGTQIATLERDKEELTSEVAIAKATVSVLHVLYMYYVGSCAATIMYSDLCTLGMYNIHVCNIQDTLIQTCCLATFNIHMYYTFGGVDSTCTWYM